MTNNVCAVILAAGKSSRMGQMKQLLSLGDQTMLGHVIDRALEADFPAVYTVIGHEAALIRNQINRQDTRFHWLVNQAYEEGQSTSLRLALTHLKERYTHMMLFLGDVPYIQSGTIHSIYEQGMEISANVTDPFMLRPTYGGIHGHPVFIGNFFHDVFMQVEGDQGLRSIIKQIPYYHTIAVEDEGVVYDIDTMEQYKQMKQAYENK